MEPREDGLKKDLEAAVRTRQELGSEYESELIDSFLTRLESRLDAQVARRVDEELTRQEAAAPPRRGGRRSERRDGDTWFAMFSLVMAIPLSAIAATGGGDTGGATRLIALLVTWGGIVGVNAVRYVARHHTHAERRPRQHSEWA
jgi:hypothetical protein